MRRLTIIGSLVSGLGCAALLFAAGAPALAAPATTDESTSWAGYFLNGAVGTYNSVSASFTVPTAKCKATGSQDAGFWVGLDGVSSDSIEQIGFDADCTAGAATYFGWYEVYPAAPVDFSNKLSPGDSMSASVTFSGTTTYTLILADTTAGWSHTVTKSESGLSRSSAEVVTSGPGGGGAGSGPTLTNFGAIIYTNCTVNGTSLGKQNPTAVEMVDSEGRVMVSPSPITAAGTFTNTWERGN